MANTPDWGKGAYERFDSALRPPAERLVELAAPEPGERAIDLGCGSGNATVPLAQTGAHVTAVDPSLRLLGIAAQRAREAGRQITTSLAGAESLPLPDGDTDLVISNFGIIFSSDAAAAIREMLRVLSPGGRLLYTAWLPEGPVAEVGKLMRAAMNPAAASGDPWTSEAGVASVGPPPAPRAAVIAAAAGDGPRPLAAVWHDPATLAALIPGGEAAITLHPGSADFAADSAAAWIDEQEHNHPIWLTARELIADERTWRALMNRSIEVLARGAEPGEGFLVRSPYVIVEIRPQR